MAFIFICIIFRQMGFIFVFVLLLLYSDTE